MKSNIVKRRILFFSAVSFVLLIGIIISIFVISNRKQNKNDAEEIELIETGNSYSFNEEKDLGEDAEDYIFDNTANNDETNIENEITPTEIDSNSYKDNNKVENGEKHINEKDNLQKGVVYDPVIPPKSITNKTDSGKDTNVIIETIPLEDIGIAYYKPFEEDSYKCDIDSGITYVGNQLLVSGYMNSNNPEQFESLFFELNASIVGYIELTNDYQIEFLSEKSFDELEEIIEYIESFPFVSKASLNLVSEFETNYEPIDLMYNDKRTAKLGLDSQTTYFEPGVDCWDNISGDTWGLTALNIPKLWNHKKEFVPVKVGIVDTGFLSNKDKTTVDDLNYINIINSVDVKDAIQHV